MESESEKCTDRESKQLLFTQKLSDKNAKLQAENTEFITKVCTIFENRWHLTFRRFCIGTIMLKKE